MTPREVTGPIRASMLKMHSGKPNKLGGIVVIAAALLLFAAISVVAFYFTDKSARRHATQEVVERLQADVTRQADVLSLFTEQLRRHVLFLAETPPIQGIIRASRHAGFDAIENSTDVVWKQRLSVIFSAYLKTHPNAFQVRYIGIADHGRELVRVDRVAGQIRVVPEMELQQKGDRDYFSQTLQMPAHEVLISDINLNREHGEIERPYRPTMRASVPVFDVQGQIFGFVIINYSVNSWLKELQKSPVQDYLLNSEGDFLLHPVSGRSFGFDLGRRHVWWDEFRADSGRRVLESGWYNSAEGRQLVTIKAWSDPKHGMAPRLYFVATAPESEISLQVLDARLQLLYTLAALALVGGIWAYLISANIRRREENWQSDAQLAAIIASSNDAIIGTSLDGRITSWNRAAQEMFGFSEAEALGHTVESLVVPDARSGEEDVLLQRIRGDEKVERFETVRRRKDGSLLDVSVTMSPVHDRDGNVVGAAKISRDITEEKRNRDRIYQLKDKLEREVRQQTAELQAALEVQHAILDKAGYAIVHGDNDRVIWGFNPAAESLLEYREEEVVGQMTADQLFDPTEVSRKLRKAGADALEEGATLLERFATIGHDGESEWTAISKSGKRTPVLSKFSILRDMDGGVSGFLAIIIDLSERKRREAELVEARAQAELANRAKSEFLANMSHEIRTPMNAVLGMLELLQRSSLNAEQQSYAKKAGGSARALLDIINDVLDFSKIEANKIQLDPHPFRLETLLDEVAVVVGANLRDKDVELLVRLDPAIPRLLVGDAGRIKQVLINLAGNATKFTDQGEVLIDVGIQRSDSHAFCLDFEIVDTGVGMTKEQLSRVFKSFAQAEAGTARRYGGTGLGLTISQRLIRAMGGELDVESEAGKGSVFRFGLTLQRVPPEILEAQRPAAKRDITGLRVLIVDDHERSRQILSSIVQSLRWQPVQARSRVEAVALLRQGKVTNQKFDLALIDWHIPDDGAWQIACEIRDNEPADTLPIFMMATDYGRRHLLSVIQARTDVVNGIMIKPVTSSEIYDVVAECMYAPGQTLTAVPEPSVTATVRLAGMSILLVDDNETNLEVARSLLSLEGATVMEARSGMEAIDKLRDEPDAYDVVLMDMQMPVMDGLTATRQIRSELRLDRLPIVAMTANATRTDREACLRAGMNEHIGKPFAINDLVDVLLRMTARAPADGTAEASVDTPARSFTLPVIDGFDFATALLRMGGNRHLLAGQARDFAQRYAAILTTAQMNLERGDRKAAARELHSLRGVVSTLGANRFAEQLHEQEARIHSDSAAAEVDWTALETGFAAMLAAMADLVAALSVDEINDKPATQVDPVDLSSGLNELASLLRSQNMQAIQRWAMLKTQMQDDAVTAALDAAIGKLDFAGALKQLDALNRATA